jgi:hypothetical protein
LQLENFAFESMNIKNLLKAQYNPLYV